MQPGGQCARQAPPLQPLLTSVCSRRQRGAPVIHVVHASTEAASPLHPTSPGFAPIAGFEALPNEPTLRKGVNSGFIGTDLAVRLDASGGGVVLCGLTGNHCVNTTARMAGNLGYEAFVCADAVACFERKDWETGEVLADGEGVKRLALSNIHEEFCTVMKEGATLALLAGRS